jgi:hypothetical protein
VACIIATNASPPDSSRISAHQWLRGGRYTGRLKISASEFFDLDQELVAIWFRSQLVSLHRVNSISILAAAQMPAQMEFPVGTGL